MATHHVTMDISHDELMILRRGERYLFDDVFGMGKSDILTKDAGYRSLSVEDIDGLDRLEGVNLIEYRDLETTPEWRITSDGCNALRSLRQTTSHEPTDAARYRAEGRDEAVRDIRAEIFNTLKHHVTPIAERSDETSPILGMLEHTAHFVAHLKARLERIDTLEAALLNRDHVNQHAADMLLMVTDDQSQTHAQKNGAIKLVAQYLRRFVGQRNGADVPPTPPKSDDIPF